MTGADDYAADNSMSSDFVIQDSMYSFAQLDVVSGMPNPGNYYRPGTNNQTFSTCSVISDPNASRLGVSGIHFSATTSAASMVELTGE